MFCPDITENLKEFFRLKNGYGSYKDRISFSVEVLTCDEASTNGGNCQPQDKIKEFLPKIFLT